LYDLPVPLNHFGTFFPSDFDEYLSILFVLLTGLLVFERFGGFELEELGPGLCAADDVSAALAWSKCVIRVDQTSDFILISLFEM